MSIGDGIEVEIVDDLGLPLLPTECAMHRFPGRGRAALTLEVRRGGLPALDHCELLLDCVRWQVFARGHEYVLAMYASASPGPYSVAIVDFAAGRGELFLAASEDEEAYPFFYPVDELIFSKLLAERRGFVVHGCGVDYRGQGLLFPGHSGAGKSTLAELFAAVPGAHVLSDDRVAVQVGDGDVVMGGTPWHGTSAFASQRTARLAHVFFLSHGARNQHVALSTGRAAARLLALSVIPVWDRRALELTLAAAEGVAERVPAAELAFVPDQTAIAHVLAQLEPATE